MQLYWTPSKNHALSFKRSWHYYVLKIPLLVGCSRNSTPGRDFFQVALCIHSSKGSLCSFSATQFYKRHLYLCNSLVCYKNTQYAIHCLNCQTFCKSFLTDSEKGGFHLKCLIYQVRRFKCPQKMNRAVNLGQPS